MNFTRRVLVVGFVLSVALCDVHAQNGGGGFARTRLAEADYETERLRRIITAIRTAGKITLDGKLDEPSWKLAVPASEFIQRIPRTGELSEERTEVRVLYDDDNLYVGVSA